MEKSQTWKNLIEEPFPLRKERKGGAANLILIALLLEASRMVDENFDVPSVESAAKSVFGLSKGYLSIMDEIGISSVFYLSAGIVLVTIPVFISQSGFFRWNSRRY